MTFEYYRLDILTTDEENQVSSSYSYQFDTEQEAREYIGEFLETHKDFEVNWNIYLVKKIASGGNVWKLK